ncbi:MAG: hypothetical protein QOI83_3395 [Streptomycetaceae bacterium]|jgi:hypothetical protein|nr:hypothetical protein [Streptomycetaceae bacterium]
MSETVGTEGIVREAYAFACMNCGYGWEQSYDIEHHVDVKGKPFVTYTTEDGHHAPSPLTRPICLNCDGHRVRIMRSGQVSEVASTWVSGSSERVVHRTHDWHLLHLLHRKGSRPQGS